MSQTRFARLVELCEQQLNEPRLNRALETAQQLIQLYPQEPKSWHLYHLIVCLKNYKGGAASHSNKIIERARRELGERFTPVMRGDMLRDQAISLTVFATTAQLARVPKLIEQVRQLHVDDANRLACTIDVEARYYFARGNYVRAIELHAEADAMWRGLGELANQTWIANNKVRWLRALVKHYGRGDRQVYDFAKKLAKEHQDKAQQATILTGFCGTWIFSFVLTHR